mmetsp:Transcript_68405/g.177694  ORF Transcript_68405/g.177694 Transcript_68405/m.177694 type:complete len:489 (-) Transcript_68405:840-2306(-)
MPEIIPALHAKPYVASATVVSPRMPLTASTRLHGPLSGGQSGRQRRMPAFLGNDCSRLTTLGQLSGIRPVLVQEDECGVRLAIVGGLVQHGILPDLRPTVHEGTFLVKGLEDVRPLSGLGQVDHGMRLFDGGGGAGRRHKHKCRRRCQCHCGRRGRLSDERPAAEISLEGVAVPPLVVGLPVELRLEDPESLLERVEVQGLVLPGCRRRGPAAPHAIPITCLSFQQLLHGRLRRALLQPASQHVSAGRRCDVPAGLQEVLVCSRAQTGGSRHRRNRRNRRRRYGRHRRDGRHRCGDHGLRAGGGHRKHRWCGGAAAAAAAASAGSTSLTTDVNDFPRAVGHLNHLEILVVIALPFVRGRGRRRTCTRAAARRGAGGATSFGEACEQHCDLLVALLLGDLLRQKPAPRALPGVRPIALDQRLRGLGVPEVGSLVQGAELALIGPEVDQAPLAVQQTENVGPTAGLRQIDQLMGGCEGCRRSLRRRRHGH